MVWLAVLPVLTLLMLAGTHVALLRAIPTMRPYAAFGVAAGLWLAAEVLLDGFGAALTGVGWVEFGPSNLASYLALAYCYFHFFNLGETGRRMRLIIELRSRPGAMTCDELLLRYSAGELMGRRIDRLVADGQIGLRGDRYVVSGRAMSSIAVVILALRRVIFASAVQMPR